LTALKFEEFHGIQKIRVTEIDLALANPYSALDHFVAQYVVHV
jgi:hypothetical protein